MGGLKKRFVLLAILLTLSLLYSGIYHGLLLPKEITGYYVGYTSFYIWLALPLIYFSLGCMVGMVVLVISKRVVSSFLCKLFAVIAVVLVGCYGLLMFLWFAGILPISVGILVTKNPACFLIPGLLLSSKLMN